MTVDPLLLKTRFTLLEGPAIWFEAPCFISAGESGWLVLAALSVYYAT